MHGPGYVPFSSLFSVSNSGGYCTTSAGLLVSFPANTLRVCSGTGLLPEDTRTNLALWSNDLTNAVWSKITSGTASIPITTANFGTAPDGTTTASRLQLTLNGGTTATDRARVTQTITTTTSSVYQQTVYLKVNSGPNCQLEVRDVNSGSIARFLATSSWQRLPPNSITAGASVGFSFELRGGQTPVESDSCDLLVWGSDLELGSFPSSVITTGATAVQRNFDNIQALGPVLNLLGTQGANSMVASWTGNQYYASASSVARQYLANWFDSGNTRWSVRSADVGGSGGPVFTVGDGTAVSNVPVTQNLSAGAATKFSWRWSNSAADAASSTNGGAASIAARQFGAALGAPLYIGGTGGNTAQLNAPLGYLGFYPGGLSNTQLQSASQ